MTPDRETREEFRAAVEARRELGEELEPQVIDSFVERIERRIDERVAKLAPKQPREGREGSFVLALVSLGAAIPITAIALSNGGLPGLVIVWLGIVLVNFFHNRS